MPSSDNVTDKSHSVYLTIKIRGPVEPKSKRYPSINSTKHKLSSQVAELKNNLPNSMKNNLSSKISRLKDNLPHVSLLIPIVGITLVNLAIIIFCLPLGCLIAAISFVIVQAILNLEDKEADKIIKLNSLTHKSESAKAIKNKLDSEKSSERSKRSDVDKYYATKANDPIPKENYVKPDLAFKVGALAITEQKTPFYISEKYGVSIGQVEECKNKFIEKLRAYQPKKKEKRSEQKTMNDSLPSRSDPTMKKLKFMVGATAFMQDKTPVEISREFSVSLKQVEDYKDTLVEEFQQFLPRRKTYTENHE